MNIFDLCVAAAVFYFRAVESCSNNDCKSWTSAVATTAQSRTKRQRYGDASGEREDAYLQISKAYFAIVQSTCWSFAQLIIETWSTLVFATLWLETIEQSPAVTIIDLQSKKQ